MVNGLGLDGESLSIMDDNDWNELNINKIVRKIIKNKVAKLLKKAEDCNYDWSDDNKDDDKNDDNDTDSDTDTDNDDDSDNDNSSIIKKPKFERCIDEMVNNIGLDGESLLIMDDNDWNDLQIN
eukprot:CAMPEP_0114683588 /NCGR_PEP_ID=MMETSP0191-20121206/58018_1 /TAXON_ID=126664 /ORGANISM="Sorites sp." /LENGTH=123 /DNA_ID=CAMNT_0001965001 /DNA_START=819 /DNA_END=1187 /DNA_ORIENTATION=+